MIFLRFQAENAQEVGFLTVNIAAYSPRPNTPAALMENQVPEDTADVNFSHGIPQFSQVFTGFHRLRGLSKGPTSLPGGEEAAPGLVEGGGSKQLPYAEPKAAGPEARRLGGGWQATWLPPGPASERPPVPLPSTMAP